MERPSLNRWAMIWVIIYYIMMVVSILIFMVFTISGLKEERPEFQQQIDEHFQHNKTMDTVYNVVFMKPIQAVKISHIVERSFFTAEFVIRAVMCPHKLRFLRDGHNLLDIAILLVVWFRSSLFELLEAKMHLYNQQWGMVLILVSCSRGIVALRVVHLAKHLRELKVLYLSCRANVRELLMLLAITLSGAILFGTIVFIAESLESTSVDEVSFASISVTVWWAVITMTTVGYGDVYPQTYSGRIIGSLVATTGLLLVALPIAIMASNFSNFHCNLTVRDHRLRRLNIFSQMRNVMAGDTERKKYYPDSTPVDFIHYNTNYSAEQKPDLPELGQLDRKPRTINTPICRISSSVTSADHSMVQST